MHHEPGRRIRRAEHINCRPALRGKRFVFGKHAAYVGLACYRPEALATWLRLPEHRAFRPQCLPDDVRVPAGEEIDVGQIDLIEPHPRSCSRGRNYHFSSTISTPVVFEDISLVEQGAPPRQGVTRLMGVLAAGSASASKSLFNCDVSSAEPSAIRRSRLAQRPGPTR